MFDGNIFDPNVFETGNYYKFWRMEPSIPPNVVRSRGKSR